MKAVKSVVVSRWNDVFLFAAYIGFLAWVNSLLPLPFRAW